MKYIKELQRKKIFSLEDVVELTGNIKTAKSLLQNYKKAEYITSIRRNMYAALDLASGQIIAGRYEIAASITSDSYISHHSAMEYYGFANQVFYDVYVSSSRRFSDFVYDRLTYISCVSKCEMGVVREPYNNLIRVTSIERTIIDCIRNMDTAGGFEELIKCLSMIPQVDENALLQYLEAIGENKLWQRAGYILEVFSSQLHISEKFFEICKSKIGNRKNYLGSDDDRCFNAEWRLYVPEGNFLGLTDGGIELV